MAGNGSTVLGLHEALHMTDYFARAIDEELAKHMEVKGRPEWVALVEQAGAALARLYQLIGAAENEAAKRGEGEKS